MIKNDLLKFLSLIAILLITACGAQEEGPAPGQTEALQKEVLQKEALQKETAPNETLQGEGRSKNRREKITQRLQEYKNLLGIARAGTNKDITYARLTAENNFTDTVSENCWFRREETSGPGTGKFSGQGFEFAEGTCEDLTSLANSGQKNIRWRRRIDKCQSKILQNNWCARRKDDPAQAYNLTFLSWTISNRDCQGDCEAHDFKTAYIRVKR